jgi:hypothetical protein
MKRSTEENDRPAEWLRRFDEDAGRYHALVRESGGLAIAAYRLARAHCRVQPVPTGVPTHTELWAAARHISLRVPLHGTTECRTRLAAECEARGLPVIGPLLARRAA